jgi:hypothetical protein
MQEKVEASDFKHNSLKTCNTHAVPSPTLSCSHNSFLPKRNTSINKLQNSLYLNTTGHTSTWTHLNMDTPQHGHTSTWTHLNMVTPQHGHTSTWTHLNMDTPQHGHTSTWTHLNMDTSRQVS